MRVTHCRANLRLLSTNIVDKCSTAIRDILAGLVFLLNRKLAPGRVHYRVGHSVTKRFAGPILWPGYGVCFVEAGRREIVFMAGAGSR